MAQDPHPLSRRAFLASAIAAALAACGREPVAAPLEPTATTVPTPTPAPTATPAPTPTPAPTAPPTPTPTPTPTPVPVDLPEPFTLGVASGDPTPDSVILWTRLAPDPVAGGGMPDEAFDVRWEVATDDTFTTMIAAGTAPAVPGLAHSVHADATGLAPDTWYSYRFILGQYVSTTGRTRTLPTASSSPDRLRIGVSSCQHWESGHYAAHDHLAEADLDLFVFLGDYIYENGEREELQFVSPTGVTRRHPPTQAVDLATYRIRYGLYRTDAQLQRHHAAHPWIVTWDDHEVDNNYAGRFTNTRAPMDQFLERRAAAYQVWYEHMPVRVDPPATAPGDWAIHHDLVWGDLAHVWLLDGRQYRDDQPEDGEQFPISGLEDPDLGLRTFGPTALDPTHRMLGEEQEQWLVDGVTTTSSQWKVLAQQVFMHGLTLVPGNTPVTITDTWDGYHANRQAILERFVAADVDNLVVLTGDFHTFSVAELRADPYDLSQPVIGAEFMASAISSHRPEWRETVIPLVEAFNPQIKLFEPRNGYGICEFTHDQCSVDLMVLENVQDPDSGASVLARFVVDAGIPGPRQV